MYPSVMKVVYMPIINDDQASFSTYAKSTMSSIDRDILVLTTRHVHGRESLSILIVMRKPRIVPFSYVYP